MIFCKQFRHLPSRASLKRLVTGGKRFSIDIDALRAILQCALCSQYHETVTPYLFHVPEHLHAVRIKAVFRFNKQLE
jgi:hypothetical protein